MLLRGDQFVFKAAFYGVTSALLLSTSSLVASAADAPIAATVAVESATSVAPAVRPLPTGVTISGNTMSMAPIPDKPARRVTTVAAPAEATATTVPEAAAATTVVQPISLTERPAIIIRNGTITMDPIVDRAALQPLPDATESAADTEPRATKAVARGSNELNCLARAIYFEARSESTKGQAAVAQVVLARKRTPGRPKTICGVVYEGSNLSTGCQFSFTCDGIPDKIYDNAAWSRAKTLASRAIRGKLKSVARGATFYHASYVRPYWASSMVKVATIGTHIFYRP